MSNHPPHQKKKQKLNINEDGGGRAGDQVATGSREDESVPMITTTNSAVTALTMLSESIIFSGHRDGSICRWNMMGDQDSELNNNPQTTTSPLTEGQLIPDWIITSACVNLTKHEIYGKEEKLGIAGLVVRQNQRSKSDSLNASKTDTGLPTHFLYSWNHQREDMRIEINGIPQKVMIWNATTSERLSALMIDVGRCCHTKMFANPLISCLVFCKLLVDENTNPPSSVLSSSSSTSNTTNSSTEHTRIEKVWTDAIIVALQATCDAPTIRSNDDDCVATTNTVLETNVTSSSPTPLQPPQPQRKAVTPTGNIVPFYEQTRKRMLPWTAIGGFVRALAVAVPSPSCTTSFDDENNKYGGYIISITEATRKPIVPQEQSISTTDTTEESNVVEVGEKKNALSNCCGQTSCITIWDTACPGSILHVLSLDGVSDRKSCSQHLDGNVYALTLSHCNHYLLVSICVEPTSASSGCNRRHIVLSLPTVTDKPSPNESCVVSICGWYNSSYEGIAASNRGDWIVSTTSPSGVDNNSENDGTSSVVQAFLTFYSFRDLLSLSSHQMTDAVELDVTKLQSKTLVQIPTVAATNIVPTTIAVGESNVVLGYRNGTIQLRSVPSSNTAVVNTMNSSDRGSNEFVSCSTAPIGLRGVPCPHLSSTANDVNLQNKCAIM